MTSQQSRRAEWVRVAAWFALFAVAGGGGRRGTDAALRTGSA